MSALFPLFDVVPQRMKFETQSQVTFYGEKFENGVRQTESDFRPQTGSRGQSNAQ